ncbi:hypothetical protein [Frankia sp. Cr1]|uniref:hypothetical protein n=1 Tax=Frankia sp. Cr1 TaxID=3073931 RepID=UPI002AD55776|nr:hypothetical protein [Frankia sp. Cr1]
MSAGFFFDGMVRPVESAPPEFVTLTMLHASGLDLVAAVGQWNMLWEAAQFRRRFFDLDELPEPMAAIVDLGDVNITFVPRTRSRYFEYAPLLHILPKRVVDRFGLPTLRGGQWPFLADYAGVRGPARPRVGGDGVAAPCVGLDDGRVFGRSIRARCRTN